MQNFLLLLSNCNCIFHIEQREIGTSHHCIWDQNLHAEANIPFSFMFLQWASSAGLFSFSSIQGTVTTPQKKEVMDILYSKEKVHGDPGTTEQTISGRQIESWILQK